MKLAVLFSQKAPHFINHYFRLLGYLERNPAQEMFWMDLDDLAKHSSHQFTRFDNVVLLAELDCLNSEQRLWLKKHRISPETLKMDWAAHQRGSRLVQCEPRIVFSPSRDANRKWNFSLWQSLNHQQATLFICQDQQELEKGAPSGVQSFFSPRNPELHAEAFMNAHGVISGDWEPCLLAKANGRPSVKLSSGPSDSNFWGIPEVNIRDKSPQAVFEECRPYLVPAPAEAVKIQSASQPAVLHLTTLTDFSYLPFLVGMAENVARKKQTQIQLHVLALDKKVKPFLEGKYKDFLSVYELDEIWEPSALPEIESRSVALKAFSSKPKLLEHVLKKTQAPVFHCDSDVYFFSPPENLLQTFGAGVTVLFPHWNDVFPAGKLDGLYNAGMVGVRPGSEPFLKWWAERCLEDCRLAPSEGLVADQGYLDFVPILFDGVTVYRKKDHNVARWNLKTLGVHWDSSLQRLLNREQKPIHTYHAAFIDSFGFFEFKFCWDQLVTFFSGFSLQQANPAFIENVLVQQQGHWLSLARALKWKRARRSQPSFFWVQGLGREFLDWALTSRNRLMEWKTAVRQSVF